MERDRETGRGRSRALYLDPNRLFFLGNDCSFGDRRLTLTLRVAMFAVASLEF